MEFEQATFHTSIVEAGDQSCGRKFVGACHSGSPHSDGKIGYRAWLACGTAALVIA